MGTVDPVLEAYVSWTPYQYVRNNPITRIDPNGLWDITVHVYKDRAEYGYGVAVVTDRHGNEVYRFTVKVEGVGGRNRMQTDADTPLGVYDIPNKDMWLSGGDRGAYGANPRLLLNGESGEILDSKRDLIRIHGGRQEVRDKKTGKFRSSKFSRLAKTNGCLRSYDDDVAELKSITDNS